MNFPAQSMRALTVVCFTLAGKLEEQLQPSFNTITSFMGESNKYKREDLIAIQEDLLIHLGFDFNPPTMQPFVEWYLNVIFSESDEKT